MKKLTVLSVALLLATALTYPAVASTATAKKATETALRVVVTGVAKGNVANVVVTGPHFKKLIRHSSVFTKVLPGTYHLWSRILFLTKFRENL